MGWEKMGLAPASQHTFFSAKALGHSPFSQSPLLAGSPTTLLTVLSPRPLGMLTPSPRKEKPNTFCDNHVVM